MAGKKGRRGFGYVRKLPSGRWQASYQGPDGTRHTGPRTFAARPDAAAWLSLRQAEIVRGAWLRPDEPAPAPTALATYAKSWLAGRDLAARTRGDYAQIIRDHIIPAFGAKPLGAIGAADVRAWHARLGTTTGPVMRAHAYGLLRTIMGTAVADDLIPASPCRVRGGSSAKRTKVIRPATLAELEVLTEAMPSRYQLMILLAAWCQMRFGELAELRRADIDTGRGVIHIRRGVVREADGSRLVKGPKSEAGKRDVAIPPHLMPMVHEHLAGHTGRGRDALLFPAVHGGHMAPATLYRVFYPAREAAGRPDLRFHDLRHTGATLAAATGATLAELMARLGHSSPAAAMRYQHAAAERDQAIAAALSEMAGGKVVPLRPRRKAGA
jgi:integrase